MRIIFPSNKLMNWYLLIWMVLLAVLDLSAQSQKGFSIYSSEKHQEIKIESSDVWEKHRSRLKRNMEKVMGELPDRSQHPAPDIVIKDTFHTNSYTRLNIEFAATTEERIPAYLYVPHAVSAGPKPAMLALHPTGADGKKIVDGQGRENRGYAKELAERGYVVMAPDYPGFGDLVDFDFKGSRYSSGTMAGIFYHMRCVDFLSDLTEVDPDRIGVIGHSLGGHNAVFVGAFDERLKVIVSSCGWTQLENYDIGPAGTKQYGGRLGPFAQDRYMPFFREKYNLDGDKIPIDFHEMIALLAPRPFFSNSPLYDSNFDVKGVEKGIRMVEEVYHWMEAGDALQVRYPDAEHDFPTAIRKEAYEFVDRALAHVPSPHEIE